MKKIKQIIEFLQDLKFQKVSFLFEPCDLWVGAFWDKKKYWLYILPLPMVGIIIKFETAQERDARIFQENLEHLTIAARKELENLKLHGKQES